MSFNFVQSNRVCGNTPYFIGVSWGYSQIRIGLVFWHLVILLDSGI